MEKKIMLSGGRPTGKLHLGHYVGAFKNFADIQSAYDSYFIISDIHMLTTKASKKDIDTIYENAIDEVIDAIGMGINPNTTTFYLQSQITSLSHILGIFQNYVKLNRVCNTPSLVEMSKHSNQDDVSLGLVAYPILEAADVFGLKADVIPVGKDNVDHIVIAQEIVQLINSEFNSNFKIPQYLTTEHNHIVGLDGSNKMSKSLDNAIYIRDSSQVVYDKIQRMKWTEDKEELNVVLEYIRIFDAENYDRIRADFNSGILSEEYAKSILIIAIEELLEPMRSRMAPYIANRDLIYNILVEGTKKVKRMCDASMIELRNALGLVNLNISE